VIVTGKSPGSTGYTEYATIAYNASTGVKLWVARYHGPGNGAFAKALGVSPDGTRMFVTGYSTGSTGSFDYATIAYNTSTGTKLWVARYNGPGNSEDGPTSLEVSPDGTEVFVTGVSWGSSSAWDYATIAYNASTGARLWVARYNGPGNSEDRPTSLEVSPDSTEVFVTGFSEGTSSRSDYATIAYTTS
jgi:WD40 repeat protein